MNWLIYSFGNGNMLFDVFTSIALMVGAGYESLMRLAMLGLIFGGLTFVVSRGRVPWHLLCGAMMLLAVTVQIRATVTIQDLVNPGVPTRTVANIPLAVAVPAYVASEASFQLLTLVETAFALTVPPEYQVVNASMGKGFYDFQKLLGAQLPDGDLQRNLTEYLDKCVIPALNRGELTTVGVFQAQDMLGAINVAGGLDVLRLYVGGVRGPTATCSDTYTNFVLPGMVPGGDASYDLAMKQLRQSLGVQDLPLAEEAPVTTAMTRILGTGQTARAAINNVLIRERWHNAEELIHQRGNDPAGAVSALGKQLGEDLKSQAFAESIMNARFLPLLRTMAESAVYLLTPFALIMAFTPSMFGTIRSTVMAYAWLLLWAPLYAVVNYLVYAYGTTQMTSLVDAGVGITYANYVDFYDMLNQLNSFSSKIAWGVPSMAAVLSYGLGSAVSSISQGGQGFQAAAGHEASAFAHGQGRHVDPNRHLEYEDQTRIDGTGQEYHEPVLRSASGMMSINQTGTRDIAFSDGSHTTIGTTGTITHQGPDGYYSQDKDGHYLSGVWREEVEDEASGHTISMQREVLGAEIRSRGSYSDHAGIQHHVDQVENQYDQAQSYREESWSANGFTHTQTTMGDGSQLHKMDGFRVAAPIAPDGHVMGSPRPFREQSSFYRPAPSDGDPNPAWEHQNTELSGGHDGQEHYSATIDGPVTTPEDHSGLLHVTGGTQGKTVAEKNTFQGMRVARDHGSEGNIGSVDGSVKMALVDKNGHRSVTQAVLTGDHIPLDEKGHPIDGFNATAVTNDNGKYGVHQGTTRFNAESGMWEMQETDAQYFSRIDSHNSGSKTFLPSAGLTLEQGEYLSHSQDGTGAFSYRGLVTDNSGRSFSANVVGKDGKIAYSDLEHGSHQGIAEDDGHRMSLTGRQGGGDYTYDEIWSGAAFRDDGHGHLIPIGQTKFTSHGVATVDPNNPGTLIKTPDSTIAENKSAFGERSYAVSVQERPMSELPVGHGSIAIDGQDGRVADGAESPLLGGEGVGYVIQIGSGTEKFNAIDRIQNVQGPDSRKRTEHLIQDSTGRPISGSMSGVVDSRFSDENKNLVSTTLARGGDGSGEWAVLTRQISNENSFRGTYDVPSLDGEGSAKVSGSIEMTPDGNIVSMSFTNSANGKQIGYHPGKNGTVFTVGDVEADPNNLSGGRVMNLRELSHREAESEGGFAVRDVLNQAGERIWSQGHKGTDRQENNSYSLNTKIDESSTLVSKGQQSLEALGIEEHFNPDQPGSWRNAAVAAEGVRLGWNTSMEGLRAARFKQSADRITGGGASGPYDPNAPDDPNLRGAYDALTEERDRFMEKKGIPSNGRGHSRGSGNSRR